MVESEGTELHPGYRDSLSSASNIRCYALLVLLPSEAKEANIFHEIPIASDKRTTINF